MNVANRGGFRIEQKQNGFVKTPNKEQRLLISAKKVVIPITVQAKNWLKESLTLFRV
jgi:hypothetical protein